MLVNVTFQNGKYLSFTCNSLSPTQFESFLSDESSDSTMSINFGFIPDLDGRDLGKMHGTGLCNGGRSIMLHRSDVESINITGPIDGH